MKFKEEPVTIEFYDKKPYFEETEYCTITSTSSSTTISSSLLKITLTPQKIKYRHMMFVKQPGLYWIEPGSVYLYFDGNSWSAQGEDWMFEYKGAHFLSSSHPRGTDYPENYVE